MPTHPIKKTLPAARRSTLLVLVVLALILIVAGARVLRPQFAARFPARTPTPLCVMDSLNLGGTTLPVKVVSRVDEDRIPVLPDDPGTAYRIAGTQVHYVFGLQPSPQNAALGQSLHTGGDITFFLANCTTWNYVITALEVGVLPEPVLLFDQSSKGITVFIPGAVPEESLLILGVPPGTQSTPDPD
jgi:hypothetical protein